MTCFVLKLDKNKTRKIDYAIDIVTKANISLSTVMEN